MRQRAFFSGPAKRAVALITLRHIEFAGGGDGLLKFSRRRLVAERRGRSNPKLSCVAEAHRGPVRNAGQPAGVEFQPTRDRILKRDLVIARGLVAGDPVLSEGPENRADVLVLELNRTAVAVDLGLKIAIVRGLVIGLASKVRSQHREVIRDDQVILCICPRPVRHAARLDAGKSFVISGFGWGNGMQTCPRNPSIYAGIPSNAPTACSGYPVSRIPLSPLVPVIVASLRKQDGVLGIEQPELHVHPAIQVGMGDLFIKAANGDHDRLSSGMTLIIETHSEHIMLRLLRRVREQTEGEVPPGMLGLTPDDLSVIYVEASVEGVRFRPLRVSSDGDFVDRWPHGFFAERAEELF